MEPFQNIYAKAPVGLRQLVGLSVAVCLYNLAGGLHDFEHTPVRSSLACALAWWGALPARRAWRSDLASLRRLSLLFVLGALLFAHRLLSGGVADTVGVLPLGFYLSLAWSLWSVQRRWAATVREGGTAHSS